MNKLNIYFISLVLVALCVYSLLSITQGKYMNEAPSGYARNHEFVFNGNIAQYSVYVIQARGEYTIEGFVHTKLKFVDTLNSSKESFKCIVKHGDGKIVELHRAVDSPRFQFKNNHKLVFKLRAWDFRNFDVNELVVGIVRQDEAVRLVSYQVPTILTVEESAVRRPAVAFCVHFTYDVPDQLLQWIQMHLEFGVAEIVFYDAVESAKLTRVIRQSKYGSDTRVTVMPFHTDDMCADAEIERQCSRLGDCSKLTVDYLKTNCLEFENPEFKNKKSKRHRGAFNQLTANDCYAMLRHKYEFVGYYDLDEIVYPVNVASRRLVNCIANDFCNTVPSNSYYSYLKFLVKKYSYGNDPDKVSSITFPHAIYFERSIEFESLFQNMTFILKLIDDATTVDGKVNSSIFPLKLQLDAQRFMIGKRGVSHLKHIHKAFTSLVTCSPRLSNTSNFHRYIYFLTPDKQRQGKCIYHTKHVQSIFVHYALDTSNASWTCIPDPLDGHVLKHFRKNTADFYTKRTHAVPILHLQIDLDFIAYLLKKEYAGCETRVQ